MNRATILYNDLAHVVDAVADADDLWIAPADLAAVNGFILKPEGACFADICIPVRGDDTALREASAPRRINVAELARRLEQPYLADREDNVWSFGAIPALRTRLIDDAIAPDFNLTDRQGRQVTLSKYRDNKVIIMTWASW
jgi:AhpC/TSA family